MQNPLPAALLLSSMALAQSTTPPSPAVRVPTFPNSTCPIMGKKISLPLFADTVHGRIYVCCKPCIRKVLADVDAAYATAYPTTADAGNTVCPISGQAIGEPRQHVVLQGTRIALCCAGCADDARAAAQLTLTKAREPQLVDVDNRTCPIDGKPVQDGVFVVIGESIVRLSSPTHEAEAAKAPQQTLDKARAIREAQSGPAPHRHEPPQPQPQPQPQPRGEERK